MDTRSSYDLEAVLAHSSWVRALAERLVHDPGAADDIVQETWIAAERHRPDAERGLKPWLAGVVRKLALRKRRDRARVERRERAAARPEAAPSTEEAILRDELRALVGRSLADLDEPFRSTLILRYFAGLEPGEIAAREGVPPATVRTRLHRGLERLREDLDRRHGGRAAWSVACLGIFDRIDATAGLVPAAVGGGIAMHVAWKIGMAVAAVALTAWFGWETFGPNGEPGARPESAGPPVASLEESPAGETSPDLAQAAAAAGREQLDAGAGAHGSVAPASPPAAALDAVLFGRLVDASGRPIADAEFERARVLADPARALGRSDAHGRFRLDVGFENALKDAFETAVAVRKAGFATRSITTVLRRSAPTDVGDFVLQRACAVSGRLEDEGGRPIAGTVLAGPAPLPRDDPDHLRRLGPEYDEHSIHAPSVPVGADGVFAIEDVEPGALRVWGSAEGRGWVSSEPLELAAGERRDGIVLRLAPLVRSDSIVGRVLAPDGSPVQNARIDAAFQTPEYATSIGANTGPEGRFEFVVQANVPHELLVTDSGNRWSPIMAAPVRAGEEGLVLRFEEPREIEIHVKSRDGSAVDEYQARAQPTERLVRGIDFGPIESTERGERHENGVARLRVPRVRVEIEVDAPGFATAKLGPFDPARMPPRIEFELEPLPGLEGRVVADDAGSTDLTGTKVELHRWMNSGGSCVWKNGYRTYYGGHTEVIAKTGADGRFRIDLRESGQYTLLAKPAAGIEGRFPTAELGPLDLDAHVGASGLEIHLTQGGAIEGRVLVATGENPAGRIVAMNHGDGSPFTVRTDEEGRFAAERLAPGHWQVMLATEDILQSTTHWSSVAEVEAPDENLLWNCRVDAGKTAHVDLDDRHSRSGQLSGRLELVGASAEGWIATLRDAAAMRPEAVAGSTAVIDHEGRFTLAFQREGKHRLVLSARGDPGVALVVRAELDLAAGENDWKRSLAVGRLAGSGLVPEPGEEAQFRYAAHPDGIELTCRITPSPDGTFALPLAIAGPGAVERFQPAAGEMWSKWKEIATFVVPANGEANVRAP